MITTDRLLLRQWRESDRDVWAAMNADPAVMEFFPALLSREESDRALDAFTERVERDGFGWWAAERLDTGAFIGMIGLVDSRLNQRSIAVMKRLHMMLTDTTFDHPAVPEGHILREHVVYRLTRKDWLSDQRRG